LSADVRRQLGPGELGLPLVALGLVVMIWHAGAWVTVHMHHPASPILAASAPRPGAPAAPASASTAPSASTTAPVSSTAPSSTTARASAAAPGAAARPSANARIAAKRLKLNVVAGPNKGRAIILNREDRVTVLQKVGGAYLVRDKRGNQVYVNVPQIVMSP
jgi:hypothetical protein